MYIYSGQNSKRERKSIIVIIVILFLKINTITRDDTSVSNTNCNLKNRSELGKVIDTP